MKDMFYQEEGEGIFEKITENLSEFYNYICVSHRIKFDA